MARNLIDIHKNKFSFRISVPSDLDYWTINQKRVNFLVDKLKNPDYPEYSGIMIIIWIFAIYFIIKVK